MDITFDSALKRLQEISDLLENGKCSLEDSVKLFEEGIELSAKCEKFLSEAKQKVEFFESGEKNVN